MQMEVEISKFDIPVAGEQSAEKQYEDFLIKFMVEPYGSRIPTLIYDLFVELNFS